MHAFSPATCVESQHSTLDPPLGYTSLVKPWLVSSLVALLGGVSGGAVEVDFTRDIQPIFAGKCYECHGPEKQKGGLRLDRKREALQGGDSGKVILPGKASDSLLLRNVSGVDPDNLMPPKGKGEPVTDNQLALLRAWIDGGAAWPDDGRDAAPSASAHWAFRPRVRTAAPSVNARHWLRNPIDAFVLARLEHEKISPAPEADRATLIRRLSLDLIGLPPRPEEVEQFLSDIDPKAYEKLVDRLLASRHFGERWARHWLDLARYADSDGYEKDAVRPYAYLYRDWVIDAINRDLPFDQFTIEQLAGDLLPDATREQKVATGFHRQTLTNKEGGVDQEEFRCKAIADRVNTTATVWLGLTVACAECHTHKYDPITQREYYQFYAFFNNANEKDVPAPRRAELEQYQHDLARWTEKHDEFASQLEARRGSDLSRAQTEWEATLARADVEWRTTSPPPFAAAPMPEKISNAFTVAPRERSPDQAKILAEFFREEIHSEILDLKQQIAAHARRRPAEPPTKAAVFIEENRKTHVHVRGDFLRKGDEVEPATLAVLHPLRAQSATPDRLDLAQWLFDPANPLTGRVTANHIWKHLFGRGLVATVDDFGTRGEKPSHPELLDWLATEFPRLGWSRKELIRLIVTSATYRQSSQARPELLQRDPLNILLTRQNRLRLEAEVIRDCHLAVSGLMNPEIGGPSVRPPLPADLTSLAYANQIRWKDSEGPERYRRGLYTFFQRTLPYPMLMTFDAPDSNVACTRRERSNTPLQALTLMNDPVFFECAQALGRNVAALTEATTKEKVRRVFTAVLSRAPTQAELDRLMEFHEVQTRLANGAPETSTFVAMARTLMNLDEFVTRE